MKVKIIQWVYFLVGLSNLASHIFDLAELEWHTKPLLMPLLIYYVFVSAQGVVTLPRLILVVALLFSWGGDLALLNDSMENSFLIGLGSFLIAHIFYAISLSKVVFQPIAINVKYLWPFLVYGILLGFIILPNSGSMIIPLVIYAIAILTMSSLAILRIERTTEESFKLVTSGAILFVISDSLIALSMFVSEFEFDQAAIMATYAGAQFLLTKGIIKHPA